MIYSKHSDVVSYYNDYKYNDYYYYSANNYLNNYKLLTQPLPYLNYYIDIIYNAPLYDVNSIVLGYDTQFKKYNFKRLYNNNLTYFLSDRLVSDGVHYILDSRNKPTYDMNYYKKITVDYVKNYL